MLPSGPKRWLCNPPRSGNAEVHPRILVDKIIINPHSKAGFHESTGKPHN